MNVVTERARNLPTVLRRVVAYKEEEGREHEGGERKTAKRELKKGHGGRGEGSHLSGGVGGNGRIINVSINHRNWFG